MCSGGEGIQASCLWWQRVSEQDKRKYTARQFGSQRPSGFEIHGILEKKDCERAANLPACFRKAGYHHTKDCAARTRHIRAVRGSLESLLATGSSSKLHSEALSFEVATVWVLVNKKWILETGLSISHTKR